MVNLIPQDIQNLTSIQKRIGHLTVLAKEMYLFEVKNQFNISFIKPDMTEVQFRTLSSNPIVKQRLSKELEDNGLVTKSGGKS
ncbi:hypothetical protein [Companilactobacillus kedongensis]|uniref:hypothetical protein n=1 Tax=Companilactobacillus kedongensis TaxID=2486004 RepID=UPI000F7A938C|nr:hypothetical protein [Companilactobacillus kedongensis]